jgi:recombination DNA repair RAD52 pathway protein
MELENKVKEVNEILKAGEPDNITADKSRGFQMTGYSPQYVVDAMNKVFGLEGWGFEDIYNKIDKNGKEAVAHVRVWLKTEDGAVERTAYGSKVMFEKTSYGDAKKSAQTDALKKALSYFSIGNRAYHGKLEAKEKGSFATDYSNY